jgi:hypothetical protein
MTTPDPSGPSPEPAPQPSPTTPSLEPRGPDAGRPSQSALVAGVVLILVGALFLVGRIAGLALGPNAWPLWIVIPGLAMVVASLLVRSRAGLGLAVPGMIVTMVGLVLWVQATYDLYATWAYAWALVAPTGPGLAMLVQGTWLGDRRLAAEGLRTTFVGLALFLGFALFFEGVIGLSGQRVPGLDQALPYAAIGLGLVLVAASLFGGRTGSRRA